MSFDFSATECGLDNGLTGASNVAGTEVYHYVLFGKDREDVYFEYDDQIHGGVNQVASVELGQACVIFSLVDGKKISVQKQMNDAMWSDFIAGVRETFPPAIVAGP